MSGSGAGPAPGSRPAPPGRSSRPRHRLPGGPGGPGGTPGAAVRVAEGGSGGRSQRALSPFLVAAASGLFEESLADESSQAGAGDVDRGLVGGQAGVFVQITDAEHLPGVLVERGHGALVDGRGGGLRGSCSAVGCGEVVDDLAGGGELSQAGFGLGEVVASRSICSRRWSARATVSSCSVCSSRRSSWTFTRPVPWRPARWGCVQ